MSGTRRGLVIHPGSLGDVLLALPALRHLASLDPPVHRTVAVTGRLVSLLGGSACAEAAVDLDRLGLDRLFMAEPSPQTMARLGRFEVLVSWFGAGDPVYRRHLTGLEVLGRRTVIVARSRPAAAWTQHASRHLLETLAPLGPLPAAMPFGRLGPTEAERRWATGWLAARHLGPWQAVVLHPGAGSPGKIWPGFAALAGRLCAAGVPVVVVTGPADRVPAGAFGPGAVPASDLGLRELVALFDLSRALVGNDSGPSHLATAVGCPTLALFGPTDPARWAPVGAHVRVLGPSEGGDAHARSGTSCDGGHSRSVGPGDCDNLLAGSAAADPWAGLTVERVEAALRELWRPASAAVA